MLHPPTNHKTGVANRPIRLHLSGTASWLTFHAPVCFPEFGTQRSSGWFKVFSKNNVVKVVFSPYTCCLLLCHKVDNVFLLTLNLVCPCTSFSKRVCWSSVIYTLVLVCRSNLSHGQGQIVEIKTS